MDWRWICPPYGYLTIGETEMANAQANDMGAVKILDTRESDMASDTKTLLAVFNKHRVTLGRKPLKGWSDSKKKLVESLYKIEVEVAQQEQGTELPDMGVDLGPQPKVIPVLGFNVPTIHADGHDPVAAEQLDHDSAIKFIRRHRRRREIYVRIATIVVAEGGSPYDFNSYLRCSAKQAREFVKKIIGDDHRREKKHTIKVAAEPLEVPQGKKGKLFIG